MNAQQLAAFKNLCAQRPHFLYRLQNAFKNILMTYMVITCVHDHLTIVKIDITHEHANSLMLSNNQQVFDMYFINFMFIVQLLTLHIQQPSGM